VTKPLRSADEVADEVTLGPVWVDDRLIPATEATVSALDHGLVTGDGAFESIEAPGGQAFALRRHLERLSRSALGLGLPSPDHGRVREAVDAVLEAAGRRPALVRITFTAGIGRLGSLRVADARPTLVVAAGPLPEHHGPARVARSPWPRNERGALAGLKTTSYAENVRALAWASAKGASEVLFPNTAGQLCEGTGSNVFVVVHDRCLTPPLGSGCLAGVTRALILELLDVQEVDLPFGVLEEAEEIFLTSTTRGAQGVAQVDDHVPPVVDGPWTKAASTAVTELAARCLDP
jgi:branched-chain amino acid aminotransferase